MAFKTPDQYRFSRNGETGGAFKVPNPNNRRNIFFVIATNGGGWEHVSVSLRTRSPEKMIKRTPTWEEMCIIKDLFWDEEDCVVQYHPAKSQHVNNHPYTLHLWRPMEEKLPTPNPTMVGIPGLSYEDVQAAIAMLRPKLG